MSLLIKTELYNKFSPKFKKEIQDKIKSYGKSVRYKFNISKTNPDPEKKNGAVIYPGRWSLSPAVYSFTEPGATESFNVGLVLTQNDKGVPTRFKKIQVDAEEKGVLVFDTTSKSEDVMDMLVYLELRPDNGNGEYKHDAQWYPFERIDEQKASKEERDARSIRKKAMDLAEKMSDAEILEFADAMVWDKSLSPDVLRNNVEAMAETQSQFFLDNANTKKMKLQALVRRAVDNKIIEYNPSECSFSFAGNKQVIAVLSPAGEKGEYEKMADWLLNGDTGKKMEEKIANLVGK